MTRDDVNAVKVAIARMFGHHATVEPYEPPRRPPPWEPSRPTGYRSPPASALAHARAPRAPWYRLAWAWCRGVFGRLERQQGRRDVVARFAAIVREMHAAEDVGHWLETGEDRPRPKRPTPPQEINK